MATVEEMRLRVKDWEREHGYLAQQAYDVFTNRRDRILAFFPDLEVATVVEGATRWAEYQELVAEEHGDSVPV